MKIDEIIDGEAPRKTRGERAMVIAAGVTTAVIRLCYGILLAQAWMHAHWAVAAALTLIVMRREIEDLRSAMYQRNYMKASAELLRCFRDMGNMRPEVLAQRPEPL
jgi:hypothetical protein